jgi:hypothetical protein
VIGFRRRSRGGQRGRNQARLALALLPIE